MQFVRNVLNPTMNAKFLSERKQFVNERNIGGGHMGHTEGL